MTQVMHKGDIFAAEHRLGPTTWSFNVTDEFLSVKSRFVDLKVELSQITLLAIGVKTDGGIETNVEKSLEMLAGQNPATLIISYKDDSSNSHKFESVPIFTFLPDWLSAVTFLLNKQSDKFKGAGPVNQIHAVVGYRQNIAIWMALGIVMGFIFIAIFVFILN